MIGAYPRRAAGAPAATLAAFCLLAILAAVGPGHLPAQSASPDTPSGATSPDASAPAPSSDANPPLPPYAPSNNAASPLLPASPPLAPRPSIPTLSLLPDSTPSPVTTPAPLPVPSQTGPTLSPAATDALPTNGAPGTTPATALTGGATATGTTDAARRFQYAFRFSTGFTYDDNIFLATAAGANNPNLRGRSRADVLFFIQPSVSLGYGDFLTRVTNYVEFDYTADALLYTNNTDQDTVQHFISLQGAYHFAQITLSLSQGVQILNSTDLGSAGGSGSQLGGAPTNPGQNSSQVNLDASQRTGLNVYTTRGSLNYAISEKTSFDLGGYFSAYDYESLISSETISGDLYFNYSPTGKITLGLGATAGYVIQSDPAPNEFYEQINLRLTYAATSKLNFAGTVGVEFRESNGASGVSVTPVFDLTINYVPFDSTSLSFAASRRVSTSAVLTGQNFDTTGFTISASQRFFQRAYARLSFGYTNSAATTIITSCSPPSTTRSATISPPASFTSAVRTRLRSPAMVSATTRSARGFR